MKKSVFYTIVFITAAVLFSSCATNKLEEGEELVEYKNLNYEILGLKQLTKEQIREDCDMFKYIMHTCYSGIDEAESLGFNLEADVEAVFNEATSSKNKIPGTKLYDRDDFIKILRQKMAKDLKLSDQHIGISGSLFDSENVLYSTIYFEELENGTFAVKKSEEEKIQPGQIYTGPEKNLFEMLVDGETLYRFGVLTKLNVKSAKLSVDNKDFMVSVKNEDPIHQKNAWNGLITTDDTMYMSLSDCFNVNGLNNTSNYTDELFEQYLQKVCEAAKNKKNIIFDLRSNTGGYMEFPAKMLAAAYYNEHPDIEFRKEIEALFLNSCADDCKRLICPFYMQNMKYIYKNAWKKQFERLSSERKDLYKNYWKKMSFKPIRKYIDDAGYECSITEFPEPDFHGKVYLLLNRYSASAAELGTAMTFMLQNQGIDVEIIGENSMGCVKYVGLFTYYLPNSGANLYLPSVIGLAPAFSEIPEFMGESKGFYPDYWATSENILETIVDCTGDKELETVLARLGKEML